MRANNFIAAMLALIFGAPLAWEFLDRTPPYTVVSGVSVPPQVRRGDTYRLEWILNPNQGAQCHGTVYRYVRDSQGTVWISAPQAASFGLMPMMWKTIKVVGSDRKMPKDVALGRAEIYVRSIYVCNFTQYFWPITIVYDPVSTEIID